MSATHSFLLPLPSLVLTDVGAINNEATKCNPATDRDVTAAAPVLPAEAAGPVFVASAPRADAPAAEWQIHGPMTDSLGWHSATNPSPVWIGTNGTVRSDCRHVPTTSLLPLLQLPAPSPRWLWRSRGSLDR